MEIINYNKIKDQIKKFSCDTDINMWHAGYCLIRTMEDTDIYDYLNKHKLKRFNVIKYVAEFAREYEFNENSIILYREYFGANDDRGYKFYAKEESDE